MRPKLKISGIRDLQDARYCAAVGIDLISFNLENGNPNGVTSEFVKEVTGWLTGVETIGEFGESDSPESVFEAKEKLNLTWVSVPIEKFSSPELLKALPENIIFRCKTDAAVSDLALFSILSESSKNVRIEYAYTSGELFETLLLSNPSVVEASILKFPDPNSVYRILTQTGLKPFAFSLGHFTKDESGVLDYAICDSFVEEYAALQGL